MQGIAPLVSGVVLTVPRVAAFGIEFDSLNKESHEGLAAEYAELLAVNPSRAAWFGLSCKQNDSCFLASGH